MSKTNESIDEKTKENLNGKNQNGTETKPKETPSGTNGTETQ